MFIHLYEIPSGAKNTTDDVYMYYEDFNFPVPHEHILVKENMHSDDFLRIYLKYYNPNKNFCSHLLVMKDNTHEFILTDAAMNISPSLQDYVKIIDNAVDFYKKTNQDYQRAEQDGISPMIHVNFLTHSGEFDIRNQVSCNAQLLKTHYEYNSSDIYFTMDQMDTCLYPTGKKHVEAYTCPNIIVVPNIDTGNAIYKCLMKQYQALGFVVGGVVPAVLNSRSNLQMNLFCENYLGGSGLI